MEDKQWDDYEKWLLRKCHMTKKVTYGLLFHHLHNEVFYYSIKRDRNREADGLRLRNEYFDIMKMDVGFDRNYECSILEMLVAFAIRIDNEYTGNMRDEKPEILFWAMICNLGLDKYSDRKYNPKPVQNILNRWLQREFLRNGEGSIFVIKRPYRDQRTIEIWDQMQEYVRENF